MAKLQEGYRVFEYKGKRFGVPENMSDDEARASIEENFKSELEPEPPRRKKRTRVTQERTVDPETESEGFMQEIAEGAAAGLIKAGQGVGELLALPSDYFFDTDYANRVQQESEALQQYLGLDPVGLPGEIAEVATQFILPGGLAAKAAVRLSRLGRLDRAIKQGRAAVTPGGGRSRAALGRGSRSISRGERAILQAQQVGAATLADAIVASDGTMTIGDFVEGGPTLTDKNVGLTGSEEALRLLENKLKIGAEAGALFAGLPYAMKGLGIMGKATGRVTFGVADAIGLEGALVKTPTALKAAAESLGNSQLAQSIANIQVPERFTRRELSQPGTTVGDVYKGVLARFRFRGNLTQDAAEVRGAAQGYMESVAAKAAQTTQKLEEAIDKQLGTTTRLGRYFRGNATSLDRAEILDGVYKYMTEPSPEARQRLLQNLPTSEIRVAAQRMRKQVDDMTLEISRSRYFNEALGDDAKAEIMANLGSYLRKKYRVFDDPDAYFGNERKNIAPSQEYLDNRRRAAALLSDPANYNTTRELYQKVAMRSRRADMNVLEEGEALPIRTDGGVQSNIVNQILDEFATGYRKKIGVRSNKPQAPGAVTGRAIRDKLKTGLLAPKRVDNEAVRLILGEIKDPVDTFALTMADMAEFVARERFYSFMDSSKVRDPDLVVNGRLANDADIVNGTVYDRLSDAEKLKYVELTDDGVGTLQSKSRKDNVDKETKKKITTEETWVKRGVYNDISRDVSNNWPVLRALYGLALTGKGFAQKVATVYSPVTQIRNVTSAALFAAANGNVGRGANVSESISLVLENIRRSSPEKRAEFYQMLQENGIIGTQAQIREIDRLVDDGLNTARQSDIDDLGVDLAQKKARGTLGNFLNNLDTGARNAYQGGDDLWKIYNFDFERSKLLNMYNGNMKAADEYARRKLGIEVEEFTDPATGRIKLRRSDGAEYVEGDALNKLSADIVKNTVPNYERVPQFVKDLRKLPVGNFVAFPAEIIRTSTNILKRSLDEIQEGRRMMDEAMGELGVADEALYNAGQQMRDIGRRRLTGFTATAGVTGPALQNFAMFMTGVTSEALDALREIGPPWSQNSTLIPTSIDKDGDIVGYIDFSYFNPYDYLKRPVSAVLNEVNKGNELNLDSGKIATNAGLKMLSEMLSPFAEESIFAERLGDVFVRKGETRTGARVYREGDADTVGDKMAKSFVHVLGALNPGIVRETIGDLAAVDPRTTQIETNFIFGGDMELNSRIATAIGAGQDRRGNVRLIGEELARLITGIGEYKVTPERALMYRSLEYNEDNRKPQGAFNKALRTGLSTPISMDNVLEAYNAQNEAAYRIQSKMYRLIQKMTDLGMEKDEIRKALKKNKVANWERVLEGDFTPVKIPKELVIQVNFAQDDYGGDKIDVPKLRGLRSQGLERKLSTKLPEGELPLGGKAESSFSFIDPVSDANAQTEQPVAAAVPPPAAAQAGAAPAQMAVPAPPIANLDPSLLGSNPIDAMRNLQIAQRTR